MKTLEIIKNLISGFWKNGFIGLCKIVAKQWILSLLVVSLVVYLCSNSKTAIYAWFLIGVFAFYSAIKAVIEIFIEIKRYVRSKNMKNKIVILQRTGGQIFDFTLCIVGLFQVLKIFTHISKITKSTSSAISVIDDVASAISKLLKSLKNSI